jgi:hypothetical protein
LTYSVTGFTKFILIKINALLSKCNCHEGNRGAPNETVN